MAILSSLLELLSNRQIKLPLALEEQELILPLNSMLQYTLDAKLKCTTLHTDNNIHNQITIVIFNIFTYL